MSLAHDIRNVSLLIDLSVIATASCLMLSETEESSVTMLMSLSLFRYLTDFNLTSGDIEFLNMPNGQVIAAANVIFKSNKYQIFLSILKVTISDIMACCTRSDCFCWWLTLSYIFSLFHCYFCILLYTECQCSLNLDGKFFFQ